MRKATTLLENSSVMAQHNHLGIIQTNLSVNVIVYCFFYWSVCKYKHLQLRVNDCSYLFSQYGPFFVHIHLAVDRAIVIIHCAV